MPETRHQDELQSDPMLRLHDKDQYSAWKNRDWRTSNGDSSGAETLHFKQWWLIVVNRL